MYLADRLAFHVMVMVNSLFHIVPLEGKKIPDPNTVEWTDTVIQQPIGFECRFVVWDEKARQLLQSVSLYD